MNKPKDSQYDLVKPIVTMLRIPKQLLVSNFKFLIVFMNSLKYLFPRATAQII